MHEPRDPPTPADPSAHDPLEPESRPDDGVSEPATTPEAEPPSAAPAPTTGTAEGSESPIGASDPGESPPEAGPRPAPALGSIENLDDAAIVLERLRARIRAQVLGRDEVIDLVLIALLADGHVLLEDFPGSGKTTLAKTLGASIVDERDDDAIEAFRRIQFTPDLLPSDVTGITVFEPSTGRFHFRHGPIFAHVVLADEINRTSPKVQAAMLEAMAEKQVTVDDRTSKLDELFFVIATQNPLDLAGTYPLPVAQLDRFLFKIRMDHIERDAELEVLSTWQSRRDVRREDLPRVTRDQVLAARRIVDREVAVDARIRECLVDVVRAIRDDERVVQGPSTRSLVLMLPALQARAALAGRDYVSADDLEALAPRVFGHRIELAPGVTDLDLVLADSLAGAVEGLARSTLRRA